MIDAFRYVYAGRTLHGEFVSDGALLIDAARVRPVPPETAPRPLEASQIEQLLQVPTQRACELREVTASRCSTNAFRTPDDVGVAARYVALLLAIADTLPDRSLVLETSGPTAPIALRSGRSGARIGVLMPLALPPELGTTLPSPSEGLERGRVQALTGDTGVVALRGQELPFATSAFRGTVSEYLVGSLVDCRVEADALGRRRIAFLVTAGTPVAPPSAAPASPSPSPSPVASSTVATASSSWGTVELYDALIMNGLIGEFDAGTLAQLASRVLGSTAERAFNELDVVRVLFEHYAFDPTRSVSPAEHTRTPAALRDRIFLARNLPNDPPDLVGSTLGELAAREGAAEAWRTTARPAAFHTTFDAAAPLARALQAAGSASRVYLVGVRHPFFVVRSSIVPAGPFAAAHVVR